eukprot:TRINITY_DN2572_c0_g1_i1.p1 TRINITY_DN2572_c0_g1~~TRINITY_DN2572_c0_g1_i1.p1  ORF type:complete len:589 (+),score=164.85 TRINITY_DN2572_c0_g1_i1:39-1805(+)
MFDLDTSFDSFDLDQRLLRAIKDMRFEHPTYVQTKSLNFSLAGHDLLINAPTGSGKTLAFVLPILHRILSNSNSGKSSNNENVTKGLIVVPTNELCSQVFNVTQSLMKYCSRDISVYKLDSQIDDSTMLMENPTLIISTIGKITQHLNKDIDLSNLEILAIDEADLVLTFCDVEISNEDLLNFPFLTFLPASLQTILCSATLTDEVQILKKKLIKKKPISIKMKSEQKKKIEYFSIDIAQDVDKFLALYSMLKLQLITGKSLIFVEDGNRAYKLKLFLDRFSIKSCVLSPDLPLESRLNILESFNVGSFTNMILTDNSLKMKKKDISQVNSVSNSRGIDFKNVNNVIQFDFPFSFESFVHRSGRTGRIGNKGLILLFVRSPFIIKDGNPDVRIDDTELKRFREISNNFKQQTNQEIKLMDFAWEEVNQLKYRVEGQYNSITKQKIKQAKAQDLQKEILNSENLKGRFEDNPIEQNLLKHDIRLYDSKKQKHLKKLPDYIKPKSNEIISADLARSRSSAVISAAKNSIKRNNTRYYHSKTKMNSRHNKNIKMNKQYNNIQRHKNMKDDFSERKGGWGSNNSFNDPLKDF